ncbi:MAG: hypothetical protein A2Y17_04455 [Clostridiales bacterium GWF2_38_85]|nr:MAG: hypothetical protein A2Y17_04455 [Clostridiales bacterium GWF2_38_85]HBL83396.1 hypothetical protein [Clostridiales bacterium]
MKTKKIFTVAADSILIFIGIYGILFSIISTYNIDVHQNIVGYITLTSAVLFSFVLNADKNKKAIYIGSSIVILLCVIIYPQQILMGATDFINMLLLRIGAFIDFIQPLNTDKTSHYSSVVASTAFFACFGVVLSFIAGTAIIKLRSSLACVLMTLPFFSICVFFVKLTPDLFSVILYLSFLLSTFLANYIRKGTNGAKYHFSLMPVIMVFLLVICVVFPPNNYNRSDLAQRMYTFFAERLPITLYNDPDNTSGESTTSQHTGYIQLPKEYENVELSNALPSQTGNVVMIIRTDTSGIILLRGYSLDTYTGRSWITDTDVKETKHYNEAFIDPFIPLFKTQTMVNPLSFSTYSAMTINDSKQMYIEISDKGRGGEVAYTPYYTAFTDYVTYNYQDDSVVLYAPNADQNNYERASYRFNAFRVDNIFSENTTNYRLSEQFQITQEYESQYSDFAHDYYIQLDGETAAMINEVIKDQNFNSIVDINERVNAVAEYVSNCAEYSLETPRTPYGKDYVEYFLTESKQGYCMHFASAATLIYRTLGIPARYVTGYAAIVDPTQVNDWVNVTDKGAHAWVEVYFDKIGWVPIEVTPGSPGGGNTNPDESTASSSVTHSRPEISKPESKAETSSKSENSQPETTDVFELPTWSYAVIAAILILCGFIIRRKAAQSKRKKTSSADTNKAAISAWQYFEKLAVYGISADINIYEIAQKATFSKHKLTPEEAKIVVTYVIKIAKETDKSLSFFKKLIFRYVKGLY